MMLWLKKLSVVLITFMALGVYIPPTYLDANAESDEVISSQSDYNEDKALVLDDDYESDEPSDAGLSIVNQITERAKEQTIAKLGTKIESQIDDDFEMNILPAIEEVVESLLEEAGEDEVPYYGISEQPSRGYGEKIFHVYNYRTNEDIARFHVRRENRPGEGYWFNFHYHLSNDGFEEHHSIGEVFWSKDTPPKWMA